MWTGQVVTVTLDCLHERYVLPFSYEMSAQRHFQSQNAFVRSVFRNPGLHLDLSLADGRNQYQQYYSCEEKDIRSSQLH